MIYQCCDSTDFDLLLILRLKKRVCRIGISIAIVSNKYMKLEDLIKLSIGEIHIFAQ